MTHPSHRHTCFCCLTGNFFSNYSRIGQSPKVNFWELSWQYLVQAGWPSCHPTNSIKAMKDAQIYM